MPRVVALCPPSSQQTAQIPGRVWVAKCASHHWVSTSAPTDASTNLTSLTAVAGVTLVLRSEDVAVLNITVGAVLSRASPAAGYLETVLEPSVGQNRCVLSLPLTHKHFSSFITHVLPFALACILALHRYSNGSCHSPSVSRNFECRSSRASRSLWSGCWGAGDLGPLRIACSWAPWLCSACCWLVLLVGAGMACLCEPQQLGAAQAPTPSRLPTRQPCPPQSWCLLEGMATPPCCSTRTVSWAASELGPPSWVDGVQRPLLAPL
jgi:hypothetical protein